MRPQNSVRLTNAVGLRRAVLSAGLLMTPTSLVLAQDTSVASQQLSVVWEVAGPSGGLFGEITDVAVGPDDMIVVLDKLSASITRIGGDGSVAWTTGGLGQGPGELAAPTAVTVQGDGTVVVTDAGNLRLSLWTPVGAFLETRTLAEVGTIGIPRAVRVASGGGFIAETVGPMRFVDGSAGLGMALWQLKESGSADHLLHTFDDVPTSLGVGGGGRARVRTVQVTPLWVSDPSGDILVGRSDRYELSRAIDREGGAVLARRGVTARAVGRQESEQRAERYREAFGAAAEITEGELHPLVGRVFFDAQGALWITRARGLQDADTPTGTEANEPIRYDVFRWPSAERIGVVVAPPGVYLRAASRDGLVGVRRDENDVQTLVMLRRAEENGGTDSGHKGGGE
jgi:hypothetical protein